MYRQIYLEYKNDTPNKAFYEDTKSIKNNHGKFMR